MHVCTYAGVKPCNPAAFLCTGLCATLGVAPPRADLQCTACCFVRKALGFGAWVSGFTKAWGKYSLREGSREFQQRAGPTCTRRGRSTFPRSHTANLLGFLGHVQLADSGPREIATPADTLQRQNPKPLTPSNNQELCTRNLQTLEP